MPLFAAITILGAALAGDTLYTWGDQLIAWSVPSVEPRIVAKLDHPAPGGCVDEAGTGLYLEEGGRLTHRAPPDWRPRVLDNGIDLQDCMAATVLGHRGVLIVHRGMQLRFYEPQVYEYTELYSFYSASRQGGLVLADIDGDGHPDIVCGNYWARSPDSFELPWHIFAMELYNQEAKSATMRIAVDGRDVIVAQGELADGMVTRLHRPENPRQLWTEQRLGTFHYPRAIAVTPQGLVIGEDNGPGSRLFLNGEQVSITNGLRAVIPYHGSLLLVARDSVSLLASSY